MNRRIAGIAARIAGRRTGVNVNEERWIGQHSDPEPRAPAPDAGRPAAEPAVHLLKTRGGTLCGAEGEADADINHVTCDECARLHDEWQEGYDRAHGVE